MKAYALRVIKTQKYLGLEITSADPDAESCNTYEAELEETDGQPWVVFDRSVAEKASVTDQSWYNSCSESPQNRFAGKCEVVELELP